MLKLKPFLAAGLTALITLLAALPAAAADNVDARVVALYVETAPGLYIERNTDSAALRSADRSQLRAEVRLPAAQGEPAQMLMVRVGDLDLQTGDMVEVNPGERGHAFITGVRPTKPFVVRLQARGDTVLVDNRSSRNLFERLFARNQ